MNRILMLSLLFLIKPTITQGAMPTPACYDINQIQDPTRFPCDPSGVNGLCCLFGETCYSNGLCGPGAKSAHNNVTPFFIGGCTNSLWETDSCPKLCGNNLTKVELHEGEGRLIAVSSETGPVGGTGINACGEGSFCCYGFGDSKCCETFSSRFQLGVGSVEAVISVTPTEIYATSSVFAAASTTTRGVHSSYSTPIISAGSATKPLPIATSTPTSTSKPKSSNNIAVGVSVGLGMAAAFGVLEALLYLRRRHRKKRKGEIRMPTTDNAQNTRRQTTLQELDLIDMGYGRAEIEGVENELKEM